METWSWLGTDKTACLLATGMPHPIGGQYNFTYTIYTTSWACHQDLDMLFFWFTNVCELRPFTCFMVSLCV